MDMYVQKAERRRENLKSFYRCSREVLGDVRDNIIKPTLSLTGKVLKGVGRGLKSTAVGLGKAGSYVAQTYSDYMNYREMQEKIDPNLVTLRTTLENSINQAENEFRAKKNEYQAFKKQGVYSTPTSAGAVPRDPVADYNTKKSQMEQELAQKRETLRQARATSPGKFTKYILDPISGARNYRYFREISDNAREKGVDITPLQMYALYRGYTEKFKEYGKPKDKKKPMFEVPLQNPFTGQPFKQKTEKKEKIKDPVTGLETDVTREVEEDVRVPINDLNDLKTYADYATFCANMELTREERRNNPAGAFFSSMRNMGNMDPMMMYMFSQMFGGNRQGNTRPAGATA